MEDLVSVSSICVVSFCTFSNLFRYYLVSSAVIFFKLNHVVVVDLLEDPWLVDSVTNNDQNGNDDSERSNDNGHTVVLLQADVQWWWDASTKTDLTATRNWYKKQLAICKSWNRFRYLLGENLPNSIWNAWKWTLVKRTFTLGLSCLDS